jgi:hypothetical protein
MRHDRSSVAAAVARGLGLLLFALALGGCAGPDVTLDPTYQPSAALAGVHGAHQSVSVNVIDARLDKGAVRPDGREILAQGDKGKVFIQTPLATSVHDFMAKALAAAGFDVEEKAPIVVEVTIVDLPLEATQFTNWGLPSERASTLDALGALVPGPVRETRAKASFTVSIRKFETRLGTSRVVEKRASDVSADRAAIGATLSKAIDDAVDAAVVESAADIQYVSKIPVSAQEIDGRVGQVEAQGQTIEQLREQLASRESRLNDDTQALEQMRALVAADQAKADAAQAGEAKIEEDRAALNDAWQKFAQERASDLAARQALDQERRSLDSQTIALRAQLEKSAKASEGAQQLQAQLAKLDDRQKSIDAQTATLTERDQALGVQVSKAAARATELDEQQQAIQAKEKEVDDRAKNLKAYGAKLHDESIVNANLAERLKQEEADVAKREAALVQWKSTLAAPHGMVTPPSEVVEHRGPLIVVTDPLASESQSPRATVLIKGTVADDRPLKFVGVTVSHDLESASNSTVLRSLPSRESSTSQIFSFPVSLREGDNTVEIRATDDLNATQMQSLRVRYKKETGNLFVVSIGINDYFKGGIPPLHYAVADATEVANQFGAMANVPPRRILNTEATADSITKEIYSRLPSEVHESDSVIIFFSGHGAIDPPVDSTSTPEGYLLPCDADPANLPRTAIPMVNLDHWLVRLSKMSKSVVFIGDTCFSGAIAGQESGRILPSASLLPKASGTGYAILTACTGSQYAMEPARLKHGVFTYFLLKGLQGAATGDADNKLTLGQLYHYIKENVDRATDHAQLPELSCDTSALEITMAHLPPDSSSVAMRGLPPTSAPAAEKP